MALFDLTLCFIFLSYPAQSEWDTAFVSRGRNTVNCYFSSVHILSPVVTFPPASLHVLDSLLVFPPVGADEPDGPRPGLEGAAAVWANTARHLVRLDRPAAVWLDVVIPILFLLTVPSSPRATRLPLTGLSATFSCLCNINNNQNSISGHNSAGDTGKITCHCDTKVVKEMFISVSSPFVTGYRLLGRSFV